MEALSHIILADINCHCRQGLLMGHSCAVAHNYAALFHNRAKLSVAGGSSLAKEFPDAVYLPHNADADASVLLNKVRVMHNLWHLFRRCRNATIVLQSSAVATAFLGIAAIKSRETPLYMIQYNTMGLDSPVKRFLYNMAKPYINGIICPNADIGKAYGLPYCVVPDYIYTGEKMGDAVPYEEKKYDFCMVGIISRDKGIIQAAKKLAGSSYRVMIAGRPSSSEIQEALENIAKDVDNIELRLRYLDKVEYTDIIRNSRYCILNYSGAYSQHSSGVVFDILFNGIPIIGRKCKSLQFIEDYGMGYLFEDISEWNISALPNQGTYREYRQNIHQYYHTHEESREKLIRFVTGADVDSENR